MLISSTNNMWQIVLGYMATTAKSNPWPNVFLEKVLFFHCLLPVFEFCVFLHLDWLSLKTSDASLSCYWTQSKKKLKIDLCLSEEHEDKMGTQSLCDLGFIIPFSVLLTVMPPSHFNFALSSYKYLREDMQQFFKCRSSSSLSLSTSAAAAAANEQDNIFFSAFSDSYFFNSIF